MKNKRFDAKIQTSSKRIAITGSTGMLGSHLVAELLRRGYGDLVLPVRSLERLTALDATLRREGFSVEDKALRPIETGLNDPNGLREAFAGVDTVFHCAAVVSMQSGDAKELIETNVEMTEHVVDAAVACGVRRLVHTSSVAALGEAAPGHKFIDEHCELENLRGTSPYGISKFFSENRAWRGEEEGLQVVVVNPGIILGEGDWKGGGSTLIIPFAASGIPFYTTGVMGYVDVKDVARAEADLAQTPEAAGQRFILVGENLSYRELLSRVATLNGRRPPRMNAGKAVLKTAVTGEWLLAKLARRQPRLTGPAADSALRQSYYDGCKIRRFVPGFHYTPVGQTLDRVIKAYRSER